MAPDHRSRPRPQCPGVKQQGKPHATFEMQVACAACGALVFRRADGRPYGHKDKRLAKANPT